MGDEVPFAKSSRIALRGLVLGLLGSVGTLLLVVLALHPLQTSIQQLDAETVALKVILAQQKELAPILSELTARLTPDASDRLPTPEQGSLSLEQVVDIPLQFEKIAGESGLEAIGVAPEVKSFTKDRKFMPINVILKGDFLRLRKFLFDLLSLPCLEHLEELQIQEMGGVQEFRLKVWVAVNPQKNG